MGDNAKYGIAATWGTPTINTQNAYYKEGVSAGNNKAIEAIPMPEVSMKDISFVNTLNSNISNLNNILSSVNTELGLPEEEKLTLSNWVLSPENYPTLNNN